MLVPLPVQFERQEQERFVLPGVCRKSRLEVLLLTGVRRSEITLTVTRAEIINQFLRLYRVPLIDPDTLTATHHGKGIFEWNGVQGADGVM